MVDPNTPAGRGPSGRGPAGVTRPPKTALVVAKRIIEDIARRGNTVGDRLPPEHLMLEQYGVGRGTLRESLRFLELQGALVLKPGPGGGPIVNHPDAGTLSASLSLLLQFDNAPFSTIMEARSVMEPSLARMAAERMTPEAIEDLRANVDALRDGSQDTAAFTAESERFHALIAWGSGNVLFGYLFEAMVGILAGVALGVEYPERQREFTCASHEDILAAIEARDAEAAAELMARHVDEHATYLAKRFSSALEQPIRWDLGG